MARNGRLGQEPLSAPPFEPRAWPWTSPRFTRSAAAVACMSPPSGSGNPVRDRRRWVRRPPGRPTPVVATVPDALLAVGDGSRLVAEATGRRLRSPTEATWPRTRPRRAPEVPAAAPEPVLEPAPPRSPRRPSPPRPSAPGAQTPARPEASAGTRLPCLPGRHPAPTWPLRRLTRTARESPPGHDRCRRGPGARGGAEGARRPHPGRPGRGRRVHRAGRPDHLPGDGRRHHTPAFPGQMDFRVSSINDPSGVLPGPDDFSRWFRCQRPPSTGRADSDANWPNRPGATGRRATRLRPGRPELLQRDQIADHRAAGAAHPQTPGR